MSKLPSFRGIANYFYVAANWSRISDDLEQYRRQIKDREDWATQALTQQAQLHELGTQRAALELEVELQGWRRLTEHMIQHMRERGDRIEVERAKSLALVERMLAGLRETTQALEARNNAWINCTVVLSMVLERESPSTRALLLNYLDEKSRRVVEGLIEHDKAEELPPGPAPPESGPP